MTRGRRGFTLIELLIALVLGSLVVGALHRAHVQQRRFFTWERQAVEDHDAFRVAGSLLAADLREAVASEGDLALLSADSLSVRAPVGFGIVCAVRSNPATIALSQTEGLMWEEAGDSLLVYTTGGWRALAPSGTLKNIPGSLDCPYGRARPDRAYSFGRNEVDSIPVGAPVRVFRRRTYHLGKNGTDRWLARTDWTGTDMLVGPVASDGIRFRFLDDAGSATGNLDRVTAVEFQMVLPATALVPGAGGVEDTLRVVFQGRNR